MSYWETWERLYIYFEIYSQSWMSLKYMWWSGIMYGKWWLICFDSLGVFINGRFQAFRNAALSRSFIFSLWNIYLHYFSLTKRSWQRKLLSESLLWYFSSIFDWYFRFYDAENRSKFGQYGLSIFSLQARW